MAIEKVVGYVDGEPVIYHEEEPTQYETTAEVEEKPAYDVKISAEDDHGNVGKVHSVYYVAGQWIEPIWQRTLADVNYAAHLNGKVAKTGWDSLTAQEQTNWTAGLIGCLNYWDLNRIEQNTGYLSDMLYGYGYGFGGVAIKTDWTMVDFPYAVEMERIRGSVQGLINIYYPQEVALPPTLEKPNYQTINDLENILKLMKEMIHRMEDSFRYCGTFYSGQEVAF